MIDLSETYRHLGRSWTHEEFASATQPPTATASSCSATSTNTIPERPIALLATAIPSVATLSVAVHLVHAIPESARPKLADELLGTADINAADALHRCHRALELDGHAHDYAADEWLPVIYDAAAPLLESSQLDRDPPSVVLQTQEAVRWLSSSIVCLDEDSRETPAALTDTLARFLVVCVFADVARRYESPEE